MNNSFNKKISEMIEKMDGKMVQAKLNAAIDMLKKGNTEELAEKINKMDKNELMEKINEFDKSKLKELNINKDEICRKIDSEDFDKLAQLIGDKGNEIISKIKDILK